MPFDPGTLDAALFGPALQVGDMTWVPVTWATLVHAGLDRRSGLLLVAERMIGTAGWRIADVTQPRLLLADVDGDGDLEVVECASDLVVHGLRGTPDGTGQPSGFFRRLTDHRAGMTSAELDPLVGRAFTKQEVQRMLAAELCWQATLGNAVPPGRLADTVMDLLRAGDVALAEDVVAWARTQGQLDLGLMKAAAWADLVSGHELDASTTGDHDLDQAIDLSRRVRALRNGTDPKSGLVEHFGPGFEARWGGAAFATEPDDGRRAPTGLRTTADREGRLLELCVGAELPDETHLESLATERVEDSASWACICLAG